MATIGQLIRRRRKRLERQRALASRRRWWSGIVITLVLLLGVLPLTLMMGATVFFYTRAIDGLPTPGSSLLDMPAVGVTELYDRQGQTLLYTVQDVLSEQRQQVSLGDLPPYVLTATLATEDPDFLQTTAFNPISIFIRIWSHLLFEPLPPDPSLTGRLVRNVILPQTERVSNDDRLREIVLVAELNRRYSPEDILEWHLNTNDYGSGAYGIEAAAQLYLGKAAVDVTLDEAALLAAIPTAPQYNPFDNPVAARGRQQDLLRALLNRDQITALEYDRAANLVTAVQSGGQFVPPVAPEYVLYARRQAEQILNAAGRDGARLVARGGLRITTALDLDLLTQAECGLQAHLARLSGVPAPTAAPCQAAALLPALDGSGYAAPPDSGAVAVIDVASGELRALVGDALTPQHAPGPTLQPFVYLQAFLRGYTPASMVLDIPIRLPGAQEGLIYTPENPDGAYRGPVSLRDAMGAGLLPPAADLAQEQGMYNVIRLAHQMGLNSLEDTAQVLLLDQGGGASVLDVTYAYSVFASLGQMYGLPVEPQGRGFRVRDPVAVLRIEGADGELLWDYNAEQIALNAITIPERGLAYLVNDILADQRTRWGVVGQGTALDLTRPGAVVSGLAGSINSAEDGWAVGYTPQYAIGVVVSRADGEALTLDTFGLDGAAPVWRSLMEYVHARDGLPPTRWERPTSIVSAAVCERSGGRPNGACPVREEIFLDGMQTTLTNDTRWQVVEINSRTNQRATVNTPAELRVQRAFFIPPDDALDWWRANNQPLPPDDFDTVSGPIILNTVRITQPAQFDQIGGQIEIRGSLDAGLTESYQLAYGAGRNPDAWIDIGGQQPTVAADGVLGAWDTRGLDGIYSLLLTVIMRDGTSESAAVQVTIDNTPPAVVLTAGAAGQVFRWPGDRTIPLDAAAVDNLAMRRVEFYADGEYIGAAEQFPFAFNWTVPGPGTTTFTAIAYDQVGNAAEAELIVTVERSGA